MSSDADGLAVFERLAAGEHQPGLRWLYAEFALLVASVAVMVARRWQR